MHKNNVTTEGQALRKRFDRATKILGQLSGLGLDEVQQTLADARFVAWVSQGEAVMPANVRAFFEREGISRPDADPLPKETVLLAALRLIVNASCSDYGWNAMKAAASFQQIAKDAIAAFEARS